MTTTETVSPKVWIGCLASYNAGRLIGRWVEVDGVESLEGCRDRVAEEAIEAAKAAGEYPTYFGDPEEFFLADNEGFGGAVGEYTPFERVAELAEAIAEHGEAFLAYLSIADEAEQTAAAFEGRYRGEWETFEDFARYHVAELGWAGVPPGPVDYGDPFVGITRSTQVDPIDALADYLDWEMIARELGDYHDEVRAGSRTYLFESL